MAIKKHMWDCANIWILMDFIINCQCGILVEILTNIMRYRWSQIWGIIFIHYEQISLLPLGKLCGRVHVVGDHDGG